MRTRAVFSGSEAPSLCLRRRFKLVRAGPFALKTLAYGARDLRIVRAEAPIGHRPFAIRIRRIRGAEPGPIARHRELGRIFANPYADTVTHELLERRSLARAAAQIAFAYEKPRLGAREA